MATACRNPFIKDGLALPCGNCEPCLWSRRQVWAYRLQLEAMCHESSAFVTLTYSDENLPRTSGDLATLAPEHVKSWLKVIRERERVEGRYFRFYCVGEYGEVTHRPHYHVILFGFEPCKRGRTLRHPISGECLGFDCCARCRLVADTWSRGIIEVGEVNKDSCGYIAGYVMKKMTRFDDPRLNGRNPEFARQSNGGGSGLGGLGFGRVAALVAARDHWNLDWDIDVPVALMQGDKAKPLGRYLRRKLREAIGKEGNAPREVIEAMAAELLPVRQAAFDASSSFKEAVIEAGNQKYANFMAKRSLYGKKRVI